VAPERRSAGSAPEKAGGLSRSRARCRRRSSRSSGHPASQPSSRARGTRHLAPTSPGLDSTVLDRKGLSISGLWTGPTVRGPWASTCTSRSSAGCGSSERTQRSGA